MKIKVRAVICEPPRIVLARELRQGRDHLTLPGGRPKEGEGLAGALVREVREETGLQVEPGRLLYVADVVLGSTIHELNVVFLARTDDPLDGCVLAGRQDAARVMPPILETIFEDMDAGRRAVPRYLGNVYLAGAREPR